MSVTDGNASGEEERKRFFDKLAELVMPAVGEGGETRLVSVRRLAATDRLVEQLDRFPRDFQSLILASFADALEAISARNLPKREGAEPVTDAERAALDSVGVAVGDTNIPEGPIARSVLLETTLLAGAVPIAQVATAWGVNDSRLRQRLRDHTLVGIKKKGAWFIPSFQLEKNQELPGLGFVLKAIRGDARPVQIASFFETIQPDLIDEEERPMTPRRWLLEGRDPAVVADLARDI